MKVSIATVEWGVGVGMLVSALALGASPAWGQTQACCFGDGSCSDMPDDYCINLGGTPKGPGSACLGDNDHNGTDDACDELSGPQACCLPDNSCQDLEVQLCLNLTGEPQGPMTVCLGDQNGNGDDDACEGSGDTCPEAFAVEFSLDIGSDTEMSDPNADRDEGYDPGDVYLGHNDLGSVLSLPSLIPGGRDGFKDDLGLFGTDPAPDPPEVVTPPATRVPVGTGGPADYVTYFDLDGHDQIDIDLSEFTVGAGGSPQPLWMPLEVTFPTNCIHPVDFILVSFDDDGAAGWPGNDVPVLSSSAVMGTTYGSSNGFDEVMGTLLTYAGAMQYSLSAPLTPIGREISVSLGLNPNPDVAEADDDDIDSLDLVEGDPDLGMPGYVGGCEHWIFTVDHEAHHGLDPGSIYAGPVGGVGMASLLIDQVVHLGLEDSLVTPDVVEDADLDAIEIAQIQQEGGSPFLGVLFSVDEDDPLTVGVDESGGLDSRMIYVSLMTGTSSALITEPLADDIDALAGWCDEIVLPDLSPPMVSAAISRRTHGTIDYDVDLLAPLAGYAVGVESRQGGPTELLITFNEPVFGAAGLDPSDVSVVDGLGSPITVTAVSIAGSQLTVELSGVGNATRVTCTFGGIEDGDGSASVSSLCFGVLLGDVTGDGTVNIFDLLNVRNQLALPVAAGNFRADIDLSNAINVFDLLSVRNRLTTACHVPCP